MLAVDTNLIVRYLTRDDEYQFARAEAVIEGAEIYVSCTVLLETEWVLRSTYRYKPHRVIEALRSFVALPSVVLEDVFVASQALEWAAEGMDLADALHLANAQSCEVFVSFDRDLVEKAVGLSPVPVRFPE